MSWWRQTLSLQPVGQLSNTPSRLTMTWLGVELPPDGNGFHKLDGKYHTIFIRLPTALLKSVFRNCKTDCSTGSCTCPKLNLSCTDMCGVCQGLTINKHGYLSVSDTVMMVTIVFFFILRNVEYHLNFAYTCVTKTWLCIPYGVLEGHHLVCVQIIGIIQTHLNYNHFNSIHFCVTGLELTHTGYILYQYHKVSAAIFQLPLCSMNMDTRLVLFCFWWRSYND